MARFHELALRGLVVEENLGAYLDGLEAVSTAADDLIPSGWRIVEDVAPTLKSAADLDTVSFMEPDEDYVPSETQRQRAKAKKANLGLADLKVALSDQGKISKEARRFYIVFLGTVLLRPDGGLCVACLRWVDDGWHLNWHYLGYDWRGLGRLARSK